MSDHSNEAGACATPLADRLRHVPADARLVVESEDGLSTRYIPIGRLASEAISELSRLQSLSDQNRLTGGWRDTGWLIEDANEPQWLTLKPAEALWGIVFTKASLDAIRFARRQDAEDYVACHLDDAPVCITEHQWSDPASPPLPDTGGWRDIESAPKDGSYIVAWGKPCSSADEGPWVTRWQDYGEGSIALERWKSGEGPKGTFWHSEPVNNWTNGWKPTHWQPLPSPPLPLPGGEDCSSRAPSSTVCGDVAKGSDPIQVKP